MVTADLRTLCQTAGEWHSGQTSPLYSFASTGVLHYPPSVYRWEIKDCLKDTRHRDREAAQRAVETAHWHDPAVAAWVEDEHTEARADRANLRALWRHIVTNAPPEDEDR